MQKILGTQIFEFDFELQLGLELDLQTQDIETIIDSC